MADLKVPVAWGPEGLTLPKDAIKGLPYQCPECQAPLRVRKGRYRKHFYHPKALHPAGCAGGGESLRHLAAKVQLKEALHALKAQGEALSFRVVCPKGHRNTHTVPLDPLDQVVLEHPFEGRRLDLAVLRDGKVILGIEVYVEHRVDEAKRQALQGIPWVELAGHHILHQTPLTPLQHNFEVPCHTCAEHRKEEERQRQAASPIWSPPRQPLAPNPNRVPPLSSRLKQKMNDAQARVDRQHDEALAFFEGPLRPGEGLYREVVAYVNTYGLSGTFTSVWQAVAVRCVGCRKGILLVEGTLHPLRDCLHCQQHYADDLLRSLPRHPDHTLRIAGKNLDRLQLIW